MADDRLELARLVAMLSGLPELNSEERSDVAGGILAMVEDDLVEAAAAIAAQFGAPPNDVLEVLRGELRKSLERAAEATGP